jgi:hypothetical protein
MRAKDSKPCSVACMGGRFGPFAGATKPFMLFWKGDAGARQLAKLHSVIMSFIEGDVSTVCSKLADLTECIYSRPFGFKTHPMTAREYDRKSRIDFLVYT